MIEGLRTDIPPVLKQCRLFLYTLLSLRVSGRIFNSIFRRLKEPLRVYRWFVGRSDRNRLVLYLRRLGRYL